MQAAALEEQESIEDDLPFTVLVDLTEISPDTRILTDVTAHSDKFNLWMVTQAVNNNDVEKGGAIPTLQKFS